MTSLSDPKKKKEIPILLGADTGQLGWDMY